MSTTTTTTTTTTSGGGGGGVRMYVYAAAVLACASAAAGRTITLPGVTFASFPDSVQHYDAVTAHDQDSRFLQTMMLQDRLWRPILNQKVRMIGGPREPTDHFAAAAADGPPEPVQHVVYPLREVVLLMTSNSLAGTDVAFVMETVRTAMACSAMKHVSLQSLLLRELIAKNKGADATVTITQRLEQMLRVAVDKLAAVDELVPLVARMHYHVRQLMVLNADLAVNELNDISKDMLEEMNRACVLDDSGPYVWLIAALKDPRTSEKLIQLDEGHTMDENMRGTADLASVRQMHDVHGSLNISETIHPDGFVNLSEDELKRLLAANRAQMIFLWQNLPIKSLTESQLNNLFNSKSSGSSVE